MNRIEGVGNVGFISWRKENNEDLIARDSKKFSVEDKGIMGQVEVCGSVVCGAGVVFICSNEPLVKTIRIFTGKCDRK